jgi:flagellar assembly protein FliH
MANPKEYQRWQMTSFDEVPSAPARTARAMPGMPAAPATQPAPTTISLPTAAELEMIREQARAEGHAEGVAAGQDEGYAAGRQQGYEDGLEQGREQGRNEGLEQGRLEAADELASLSQIATTFGQAVQDADETIARDVLELALHLARNMVRTAFDVKPELILPVVRQAIDYLPSLQQPALLTLHPDDALIVRDHMGHELDKTGWRIVEDAQLARGGCRVDTASNQIDAQIGSRWQRLASALHGNVEWLG